MKIKLLIALFGVMSALGHNPKVFAQTTQTFIVGPDSFDSVDLGRNIVTPSGGMMLELPTPDLATNSFTPTGPDPDNPGVQINNTPFRFNLDRPNVTDDGVGSDVLESIPSFGRLQAAGFIPTNQRLTGVEVRVFAEQTRNDLFAVNFRPFPQTINDLSTNLFSNLVLDLGADQTAPITDPSDPTAGFDPEDALLINFEQSLPLIPDPFSPVMVPGLSFPPGVQILTAEDTIDSGLAAATFSSTDPFFSVFTEDRNIPFDLAGNSSFDADGLATGLGLVQEVEGIAALSVIYSYEQVPFEFEAGVGLALFGLGTAWKLRRR